MLDKSTHMVLRVKNASGTPAYDVYLTLPVALADLTRRAGITNIYAKSHADLGTPNVCRVEVWRLETVE